MVVVVVVVIVVVVADPKTVWLRISIQVLKIDMKRYRQALAVNDSLRDTDRPGGPWGLLRPPGAS